MISFNQLGKHGRFGNQLFQYAFIRSLAQRKKTTFFCPPWAGDELFNLNDKAERTDYFKPDHVIVDNTPSGNVSYDWLSIKDKTDVVGFFQSETYFSKQDVLKWFSLKEDVIAHVKNKYKDIDFSQCTAIHLRLGDYLTPQPFFYVPQRFYFKKALELCEQKHILVFSDEPDRARAYLSFLPQKTIFITGNKEYEDLYLLTQCKNVICSSSSFSWWGAYLGSHSNQKVIVPAHWFLPYSPMQNSHIYVDGWIRLPAIYFYENYYTRYITIYYKRFIKILNTLRTEGVKAAYVKIKNHIKIVI